MSDSHDHEAASFEALSALADGEATERDIAQACAAWRGQEDARERWHTYQLIGDVMRSDTLAQPASGDAAFLEALRSRLAQEPVVLAPAAAMATAAATVPAGQGTGMPGHLHRRRWAGPTAVAAGFVMALGAVLTTLQDGGPVGVQATLAQGGRDSAAPMNAAQGWVGQEAALAPTLRSGLVADNSMVPRQAEPAQSSFTRHASEAAATRTGNLVVIRDPQLDEFLAAHREFAPSSAFAQPAGLVRSVAFEAPGR